MRYCTFLLMFFLFSCSAAKVVADYDTTVDFSNFKSYLFYEDVGKGLNEFDVKRVISAMKSTLEKAGFVESENPDFFINFSAKITEARNRNTIGIGIGNGGINGGFGMSGGIPINVKKMNEEFVVEFVNSENNMLFWEAVLNSTVKEKRKPKEKELHFKEIIPKILEKYPPK